VIRLESDEVPKVCAVNTQRGKELVLIGELLVIATVVRQSRVHDGAGDEEDHGPTVGSGARIPSLPDRKRRGLQR